jgi:hypothetical protein
VAAAVAGATALVALVDPGRPGRYPVCPYLALTGHYCPGCGGLRAVHALTRGDVALAADLNVLLVAALPLLLAVYVRWVVRRWRGTAPPVPGGPAPARATYLTTGVVFAVMLAFGVLRNLPAFAVLAP